MALQEFATPSRRALLSEEFRSELLSIADWWLEYSQDHSQGGFYGEVGADNEPVPGADKSIVLNTRILWFFSELAQTIDDPRYRQAAKRSYDYLLTHFLDESQGGFFWMLDASGRPKDTKKQVYAQAFAIYALVSYYRLTENHRALAESQKVFVLLERHTIDREKGGYLEAFKRDWGLLDDVRLSDKDLNFPKTMNTHLHVLEAYTTLHQVDFSEPVADALRYAIECFESRIIIKDQFHLRMFMGHDWHDHSPGYTYGHDIECSWLLAKADDSLGDPIVSERLRPSILGLAEVCLREAMGEHGEMYDGFEFDTQAFNRERVWWVQAEAMVGYYTAYTLTGDERFARAAEQLWAFIQRFHRCDNGEWSWLSSLDDQRHTPAYKLGPWKGPYHNGRAMLEMLRMLAHSR